MSNRCQGRIAVVGGGFCGLAAAYYLLAYGAGQVTLFEHCAVGSGSSGIAAGLLHPFPGFSSSKAYLGDAGMAKSLSLIDLAEQEVGGSLSQRGGVVRFACNHKQMDLFAQRAQQEPGLCLLSQEEARRWGATGIVEGGLFIKKGVTVYAQPYVEALLTLCVRRGLKLVKQTASWEMLGAFDARVIAVGREVETLFPGGIGTLKLSQTKGQLLLCRDHSPEGRLLKRGAGLIGKGYLTRCSRSDYLVLGATYEHRWERESSNLEEARAILENRLHRWFAYPEWLEPLCARAGVRVRRRSSAIPLVSDLARGDLTYLITGMGSRGLLYHALVGDCVARQILCLTRGSRIPAALGVVD